MSSKPITSGTSKQAHWQRIGKRLFLLSAGLFAGGYLLPILFNPPPEPVNTPTAPLARQACTVLTIYDGDTLACDINHNQALERPQEQIRLLGIDAPEMHYSKKNREKIDQPFAKTAKDYLENHFLGKTIYYETDIKQSDRYGRTLAHVYASPKATESINATLLKNGYATVLFIPPNHRYQETYQAIHNQALKTNQGCWQLGAGCTLTAAPTTD